MKKLLQFIPVLIFLMPAFTAQAQWLNSPPVITPALPLECNPTNVALDWTLGCINWTVNGYGHTITTDTIYVDVDISGTPICFGALSFYNHTENLGNVPAGTYTLKIRFTVTGVFGPPPASSTYPLVIGSCCSVDANFASANSALQVCPGGSLTFNAADTSLLSYNWKLNGVPVASGMQTTQTFAQAGTYTLSLQTSDSTCTDSSVQTIVVADPVTNISAIVDESCPGTADGSINLQVSSGLPPYTFSWSNGATSQNISQLGAGTYVVSVTDSIGCTTADTASLTVGIPVIADFQASDSLVCVGSSVSFTNLSTGATMHSWYVNGTLVNQTPSPTLPVTASGTYLITLVSENTTCNDSASFTIHASAPPTLNASLVDETCTNSVDGAIDMTVSGGIGAYTYSWSNGATTEDLSALGVGSYSVTVTDSLGCVQTESYSISLGAGISASFSHSDSTVICEGTAIDFSNTSSGGSTLSWFNNGQLFSQMATPSLSFAMAGTFAIQLAITDSICTDTATLIFDVNAAPQLSVDLNDILCPDDGNGAVDLSLTGGTQPFEFDWSNGKKTEDLANLGPGIYSVEITDAVGCVLKDTFEIALLGGVTAAFDQTVGGSYVQLTDMSDSTAISWQWDLGDGNSSTQQNPLHQFAFFGTYEVCLLVTDQYGCADSICEQVSIATAIDPSLLFPLTIYPNPTQGQAKISLPSPQGQQVKVELFDALGRKVWSQEMMAQQEILLDLGTLATGVYQVLLSTGEAYYQGKLWKE